MDLLHRIGSDLANAQTSLVITFEHGIWTMLTLTKSILVARERGRLMKMTFDQMERSRSRKGTPSCSIWFSSHQESLWAYIKPKRFSFMMAIWDSHSKS